MNVHIFRVFCVVMAVFASLSQVVASDSSRLGGKNPLHDLVRELDGKHVKGILINSAKGDYPIRYLSRLENAAIFNMADVVEVVVKTNPEELELYGVESLYSAASMGSLDVVVLLLEYGVSPNAKLESGYTALYSAVQFGELDVIRKLVDSGANINYKVKGGPSLMVTAVIEKRQKAIEVVIDSGYVLSAEEQNFLSKNKVKSMNK